MSTQTISSVKTVEKKNVSSPVEEWDDTVFTEENKKAYEKAKREQARGETYSLEEVMRER